MRSARSIRITGIALEILIAIAIALLSRTSRAGDADTERARALFDEAGELERRGQWGAAQERIRAALRLRATPQLYYALGWALENDDKLLEAKAEYETSVRLGRDRAGADEATRLASTRLAELDRATPIIKVRSTNMSRVIVDGRDVKREYEIASTPLNPGSHVVRVEPALGPAVEQIVYVGRGTVKRIEIDASDGSSHDKNQDARLRLSATSAPKNKTDEVLPWFLVAGGAALAAGGGALLFAASADADQRDVLRARWCAATACSGTSASRRETAEAASYRQAAAESSTSADTKQAIGVALVGSGVIAAAVGVVLLLRAEDHSERASSTKMRPRASAAPLPGGGAFATTAFSF